MYISLLTNSLSPNSSNCCASYIIYKTMLFTRKSLVYKRHSYSAWAVFLAGKSRCSVNWTACLLGGGEVINVNCYYFHTSRSLGLFEMVNWPSRLHPQWEDCPWSYSSLFFSTGRKVEVMLFKIMSVTNINILWKSSGVVSIFFSFQVTIRAMWIFYCIYSNMNNVIETAGMYVAMK